MTIEADYICQARTVASAMKDIQLTGCWSLLTHLHGCTWRNNQVSNTWTATVNSTESNKVATINSKDRRMWTPSLFDGDSIPFWYVPGPYLMCSSFPFDVTWEWRSRARIKFFFIEEEPWNIFLLDAGNLRSILKIDIWIMIGRR